jgi:hypothetical protein
VTAQPLGPSLNIEAVFRQRIQLLWKEGDARGG